MEFFFKKELYLLSLSLSLAVSMDSWFILFTFSNTFVIIHLDAQIFPYFASRSAFKLTPVFLSHVPSVEHIFVFWHKKTFVETNTINDKLSHLVAMSLRYILMKEQDLFVLKLYWHIEETGQVAIMFHFLNMSNCFLVISFNFLYHLYFVQCASEI